MQNNKIYLNNLDKAATDTLLKERFAEYGEITEVDLPTDRKSKQPKGYAFITYALESSAKNSLEQDGKPFLNNDIIVQMATEKTSKKLSTTMTNNEIIKKLRIALDLKEPDMIKIFELSGYEIKKSELSAIFRKEGQKNYRECSDLLLSHFLDGFIIFKRGVKEE